MKLIRDSSGIPVQGQFWDGQNFVIANAEGVDFSKIRMLRDALGSPIPQIWDGEKFIPKGEDVGGISDIYQEEVTTNGVGTAFGYQTKASGYSSHAVGYETAASGDFSHAEGFGTKASEFTTHAEGNSTIASGTSSHAEGNNTKALGSSSHAEGFETTASGSSSHAEGFETTASNNSDHAEGSYTEASGSSSHAEGSYAVASGYAAHAEGSKTIASGYVSHAEGNQTQAIEYAAHAEGESTKALNFATHSEGNLTVASGPMSHAEGGMSTASGTMSHSEGGFTKAIGDYSHASGNSTVAKYAQTVIGQYNEISSAENDSYDATKELFIIGNGNEKGLSNAFKVLGTGQTFAEGPYASTGADYAEYFEWEDENLDNEDRVGYFVTLEGEMIRKTNSQDNYVLGIVSSTPSIIGDNHEAWKNKYLCDEWGRIQYHNVTIPAVTKEIVEKDNIVKVVELSPERIDKRPMYNPKWNPSEEYISREHRKEWAAVGMLGKLFVRDDGTCVVNDFCKSNEDGIATLSKSGIRVIKRVSENIVQVLFK